MPRKTRSSRALKAELQTPVSPISTAEVDDAPMPRLTRSRLRSALNASSANSSPGPASGLGSPAASDHSSTPATSFSNTPSNTAKLPGFQPASSLLRLEIELPQRNAASSSSSSMLASDSMKALNKSKYSLSSKGPKNEFWGSEDGEDDEDDEDFADPSLARDARLARRLQKEEDRAESKSQVKAELADLYVGRRTRSRATKREAVEDLSDVIAISSDSSDPIALPVVRPKRRKVKEEIVLSDDENDENDDAVDVDDNDDDESIAIEDSDYDSSVEEVDLTQEPAAANADAQLGSRRHYREYRNMKRVKGNRDRLEAQHPVLKTMWSDLEAMPMLNAGRADQPESISRNLKPFQLEGLAWMKAMEKTKWGGGLLGDEMGLGKTIQAVSLIMSDYPAKKPSLVLVPPVALMQWMTEIAAYTDGRLKTLVFHGTNSKSKNLTVKDIKKYDVIIMSYNSLESIYRRQEKGFARKAGIYKEESIIHKTTFHRAILDEAHCIKTRSTMTAKACFALKVDHRWCLTGTPLQNRIGEFFSLLRFLEMEPFANYVCRDCSCSKMEWTMNEDNVCTKCKHRGMRHVSVFNQELLDPIQRYGNTGPGQIAFKKLRLLTSHVMLRRMKKDHTDSMELPVKEVLVDRQFFSEVETDFANSIMTNTERKFTTYVENQVMLNNYANIFGLIMQMRQVADHPDLILKKDAEGSQNVMVCCICDEPAEEAIRSRCKHDFCRECAKNYLLATEAPDCPRCHIPLMIDLEQPEIEQDELLVKKTSIINRIRMENWTSSSKIELLVHKLYQLRSDKAMHKSIIFSQFTTMLQLIEWRLRRAGITTVMLDGSMTPAQRQASIEYFKSHVDVECFLVSLKAGGVALNLTEASRVFIVDPWWNPAAEWQSADRCHRIGQTRPCIVTRLCIEDSVESRMVLLQEKKTRMINSTINSDDAAMESLTPEDLQFLFRGT